MNKAWIWLVLTLLSACPAAKAASFSEVVIDPYGSAQRSDPIQNKHPRAQVQGAYRSKLGIQLHPYCISLMGESGMSRADVEAAFEKLVLESVISVLGDCSERYPELKFYISQWVMQARRAVITCKKAEPDDDYEAEEVPVGISVGGFGPATAGLEPVAPLTAMDRIHKPLIVFTDKIMRLALRDNDDTGREDLIHEIFHATSANSHTASDHSSLERLSYAVGKTSCKAGTIVSDRINMISLLCTGIRRNMTKKTAAQALRDRMNRCGKSVGCEQVFTRDFSSGHGLFATIEAAYTPTTGLSTESAASLCAKIAEDGACQDLVDDNGPEATRLGSGLREVGERVSARLEEILPKNYTHVPAAFFEVYPEFRARLNRFRDSGCFKAGMHWGQDNGLWLRMGEREAPPFRQDDLVARSKSFDDLSVYFALRAMFYSANCTDQDAQLSLEKTLWEIQQKFTPLLSSSAIQELAIPRALGKIEKSYMPSRPEPDAIRLMGERLWGDYQYELARGHYLSPYFTCQRSIPLQLSRLEEALKASPEMNCEMGK